MYGLPAAGAIGGVFQAGRDFSRIAVSPSQNFALVTAADTGAVMLYKPGVSLTPVAGAQANPDILALSPTGASAALWFPLTNQLEAVTGLPNTPVVRTIDASFLNASPLALAISDDGQWTVGLWNTATPAAVYAFGPSSQVIPLQTDPGVVALAFFSNNHSLVLATAARATSIADLGGSMLPSVLFDYSSQPLSPRAIALSSDNSRAVVADSTGKLLDIAIPAATANLVDCHCSPDSLYGLGGALFRLNGTSAPGRSGRTTELKLFDAAAGAVWIVPPALNQAGGKQ
jgi:DNA-binding beta-propeller fold protein YncE